MRTTIFDVFIETSTKTKIATACFILAKLFFFLTILSIFASMTVAIFNLIIYVSLIIASASLCIIELIEKQ